MSHKRILFRPPGGWVGDVIPYFWDDTFWLFYLHETRTGMRDDGTSWHLATTRDFIDFDYRGEALPHGDFDEQDLHAYTGSVVFDGESHHLFYTGYNPNIVDAETGQPLQAVMHAISVSLSSWKKIPEDTFYAPRDAYDPADWRDPFVYRTPGAGGWSMLLAARVRTGPERRRGCIARLVSPDLRTWSVVEPLYSPSRFVTHECPDLFREGQWWHLIYSEFSERFTVRSHSSRDPGGPWLTSGQDDLDGRGFYAAKTASDGRQRYAFGWMPTKLGLADDGDWEWAGDLVVHEVVSCRDGSLASRMPDSLRKSLGTESPLPAPQPVLGQWNVEPGKLSASAMSGFSSMYLGTLPARCRLAATAHVSAGTRECGLILRASDDCDAGYFVRLEPYRRRLVFDRWPRKVPGRYQWEIGGEMAHTVELERILPTSASGTWELELLIDDTACVTYINGMVAMSTRMYDRRTGGLGLFVGDGAVTFTGVSVFTHGEEAAA